MTETLLDIGNLSVTFNTPTGPVHAVRDVSLHVREGEILGVVGESGCGKSVTFRALLGLAPRSSTVGGDLRLNGSTVQMDGELCENAALIYQNPGAALNPVFTIGQQLGLVARSDDRNVLAGFLERVGLPDPEDALSAYPHEFSGGMRQRAMIALALASNPEILLADEPTTALDVTTQAQVLELLEQLRSEHGLTIIFISHDLAVIRQLCDRTAVMYAGKVVELGGTETILRNPSHPYTQALIGSIPREENLGQDLDSIPGMVPDGRTTIHGCAFAPRCSYVRDECLSGPPGMRSAAVDHSVACVLVGKSP